MKTANGMEETIKKNLNFTASAEMRERIFTDIMNAQEESKKTKSALIRPNIRSIIMKSPITKLAAVLALICTGILAAAVVGIKYHYIEQDEKGRHLVQSEDGKNMISFAENHADSPEQAVAYAEEIALLKQQGKRELVGVSEIEVNGQHDSRHCSYKYNLSDGRTLNNVGERDPDDTGPRTLVGERRKELRQLWHEQLRQKNWQEFITTEEKQVKGRVFSFKKWKLVLSDGTEVVYSIGRPKENQ